MKYKSIMSATFLYRKNRFISVCKKGFLELEVYVPNTGRCNELLIHGTKVYLAYNDNPNRKTSYTLIMVQKGDKLINIDSQAPNTLVEEGLNNGKIDIGFSPTYIKREYTHGDSRFDFYIEGKNKKILLEVKGVTLENCGITAFPDAPTKRGLKHIKGLVNSQDEYEAYIVFVIQMEDAKIFTPNYVTDKDFSETLKNAKENGVNIIAYNCEVFKNEINIKEEIPVDLEEIWNLDLQNQKTNLK
ncbi:DNA/RNA nuclease SfsA [Peptoniphilus sp. MSJ-1]|uniref:Sugar fermentation stimulation protein homolog n=1 Tax=Peptoniphilus ovalis TaxID=2841503 RepID=A0ABS6FJQ5_9FIRM|nr:DNA/RNA nuclease SfsA [Peptoniphilus ovalis]MBU5669435.1 DNA/RNA nuclease SfsA [Peptoniphilus ovalis]